MPRPISKINLALRCSEMFAVLFEPLRSIARANGYNLVAHGSLVRDIDLIAVPWSEQAIPPVELANMIQSAAATLVGQAEERDRTYAAAPEYFDAGQPGAKPFGRLCWSFWLHDRGPYIDLSVMPPERAPSV